MRLTTRFSVAILCCTVLSPLAAQERLSIGVLLGSTSDYDRGGFFEAPAGGRQLSVGIPVRWRLTHRAPLTFAATGAIEWSYAPDRAGNAGLMQVVVGAEVQAPWRTLDARAAPLVGLISRRGDRFDSGDHLQYGVELGSGVRFGTWRVGYSFRHAWVGGVRRTGSSCAPGTACRFYLDRDDPTTETYDRHALVVSRHF